MKKARFICFEGTEGVGKTTQTNLIAQRLTNNGHKVLLTKEPGTPLAPLTMVLRGVMLDSQYDNELTVSARELVSQAIRSIHLEKVIYPNLYKYDYIIQDRGMLSGLAYGVACGNSKKWIEDLLQHVITPKFEKTIYNLYDNVIYLQGNVSTGLNKAKSAKQEFTSGDSIEAKGLKFMLNTASNMTKFATDFNGIKYINVDGKSIDTVSNDIFEALDLEIQ